MTMHERFWAKVDRNGPLTRPDLGRCWLWTASPGAGGYGQFRVGRRMRGAHIVAFELAHGPDHGPVVMHRCDTPRCVRQSHLRDGTQKDNLDDMRSKGRGAPAHVTRLGPAKLTPTMVGIIRSDRHAGLSCAALAERYGVHVSTIRRAVNREQWADV